ncbi:flagellar export chaperone FliS [Paenibacillus sp. NPDC058071]|uniref:flagellar export chaperone FliS n=1 Tax=Paenibacillus sp. NPDC058071 TaxID=3346326 RepID=UPI0036DADB76
MMVQPQDSYLITKVQTSSPGELTLMLYSGCIRFIKQATVCIEKHDFEGKHLNFVKAQNIIEELHSTLNMEYEISQQLSSLYLYMNELLMKANTKLDVEAADNCVQLLTELRDTWSEAMKTLK